MKTVLWRAKPNDEDINNQFLEILGKLENIMILFLIIFTNTNIDQHLKILTKAD